MSNLHSEVESKVFEIAEELKQSKFKSFSLFTGQSGEVLFLLNLYRYTEDEAYFEWSYKLLDRLLDHVLSQGGYHSYCNGLAGFGWFLSHLSEYDYADIDGLEDVQSGLDGYLFEYLKEDLSKQNFDLLHGGTGLATYFFKRNNEEAIDLYINSLQKFAQTDDDSSIKWPFYIKELEIDHYNFGLAHGIPSQVNLLSRIALWYPEKEGVRGLIRSSVDYLLKNTREEILPFGSYFPNGIKSGVKGSGPGRLAWCYGDVGICCSLWMAAQALEDDELRAFVKEVLEHNAMIKAKEDTMLIDAGLCHGTAGMAQIFGRFGRLLDSQILKNTSEYWYSATLDMAQYGDGLAGYKSYKGNEDGWEPEFGLLSGISGVGLALLSFLDPKITDWDELLLIPPVD